jgi:hypothetical protein
MEVLEYQAVMGWILLAGVLLGLVRIIITALGRKNR